LNIEKENYFNEEKYSIQDNYKKVNFNIKVKNNKYEGKNLNSFLEKSSNINYSNSDIKSNNIKNKINEMNDLQMQLFEQERLLKEKSIELIEETNKYLF
jgi:hypothetical protein